jgi:hypothetical protein
VRSIRTIFLAAFVAALSCHAWSASAPVHIVKVEYRLFPGLGNMDGHWNALTVARGGKAYIGLAHHGAGGHVVYYDPAKDRIVDLGNLNKLCGQMGLRIGPQAKVHAKFGEAKDGRIYFATHAGLWWNFARFATVEGYPGGHWLVYDPRSGETEDLGIGLRYEGIITAAYDPVYNRMYGLTYPRGHFIYYDIATGQTHDMGRVNNWESLCRTIGIDDQGNVYGTFGKGQIYKYDPRIDKLTNLPLFVPIREKGISLGRDYDKSETAWREVVWDPQKKVFYGIDESASYLFSFDPHAGKYGVVKKLGQLTIPGMANERGIPYASLALTLGKDDKLYYAAPAQEFDFSGSKGIAASHLLVFNLKTDQMRDLGEMRVPDGRGLMGAESAATAPDGTIYFVGAMEARPQPGRAFVYGGKIGSVPYRLALFIYHPEAQ